MEESFKLPGSSYDVIRKIIMGYAEINKKASLGDVAARVAMDKTLISRNAGFLLSMAIIEGGRDKAITPAGKKLADSFSLEMENEISRNLSTLIQDNSFLKNILSAIKIRGGMDDASLRAHIAYTAGKSKSAGTTTGTGAIIDLLKESKLVVEENGKISIGNSGISEAEPEDNANTQTFFQKEISKKASIDVSTGNQSGTIGKINVNLDVKVNINCQASEVDELGEKLQKLFADLSKSPTED